MIDVGKMQFYNIKIFTMMIDVKMNHWSVKNMQWNSVKEKIKSGIFWGDIGT